MVDSGIARWRSLPRRIERERIGARLLQRRELTLAAPLARLAQLVVIVRRRGEKRLALRFRHERGRDAHCPARVEHVDHRTLIGWIDAERRVRLARCRSADQQRQLEFRTLHFAGNGHHLVQ